jgi:type IV secretory pathway VirB2 component (pilin)
MFPCPAVQSASQRAAMFERAVPCAWQLFLIAAKASVRMSKSAPVAPPLARLLVLDGPVARVRLSPNVSGVPE